MITTYQRYVEGKTAEEILKGAGDFEGLLPDRVQEYVLLAAQLHGQQEQMQREDSCTEKLVISIDLLTRSIQKASDDSGALGRRLMLLTVALVLVGLIQAGATAWPYLAWWWHH